MEAVMHAVTHARWSRRGFLAVTGTAGAGLALASQTTLTLAAPSAAPAADAASDLAVAKVAASLEVLAVGTYKAALDAATAGKLGPVPAAVATYAQTAMSQHQFALDQWNGVITGAGSPAVTAPPADLAATVQTMFGQVTDVGGVAQLALTLEQIAADTYRTAIPSLSSSAAIDLAGNLQIIDRQHQSILLFVMGQYPVPETFQSGAKAYSPPSTPPASSSGGATTARDGQTLAGQSAATQATFRAVWGDRAAEQWVVEHNAMLGR